MQTTYLSTSTNRTKLLTTSWLKGTRSGVVWKKTDRQNGLDGGWVEFEIIPMHHTYIVFIVLKTIIWLQGLHK